MNEALIAAIILLTIGVVGAFYVIHKLYNEFVDKE